jgi:hypothetical protein
VIPSLGMACLQVFPEGPSLRAQGIGRTQRSGASGK